jgi:hypothetical protein
MNELSTGQVDQIFDLRQFQMVLPRHQEELETLQCFLTFLRTLDCIIDVLLLAAESIV